MTAARITLAQSGYNFNAASFIQIVKQQTNILFIVSAFLQNKYCEIVKYKNQLCLNFK